MGFCIKKETVDKYKNYIGKKFGELTIIDLDYERSRADPSYKVYVKCRCSCGNKKSFRLNNLKNGHTQSCGCKKRETNKNLRSDLIGKKFGRLTVVRPKEWTEYEDGERKELEYFCDCTCGTKNYLVSSKHLKNGDTRSCGCLQKELTSERFSLDLTGKTFGRLTVVCKYEDGQYKDRNRTFWLCECSCGNTTIVSSTNLNIGKTQSCGCLCSKNEEKINKLLVENDINFKNQFWFNDLRSPFSERPLRFDFAIFDKKGSVVMLVEYDGEQHFKEMRFSSDHNKNKEKLYRLQICDKLKNEYCEKHGFSLFRIPYTYEEDVEKLLLQNLKSKGVI